MFGITNETMDALDNAPMPVGINENVKLESVLFKPLKEEGTPILQYTFTDVKGRTLRHIMWEPDANKIKENLASYPKKHTRANKMWNVQKGDDMTPEQAVQVAAADFNAYNNHILNRFFSKDEIVKGMVGVTNYVDFSKAVVKLCSQIASKETLVRLKVVYSYDYKYSVLPKNHYSPFIEEMSVPKESSAIVITQYDNVVRPKPTESVEDSLADFGAALPEGDNAPF